MQIACERQQRLFTLKGTQFVYGFPSLRLYFVATDFTLSVFIEL